jgi:hypothetical protein
VRSGCSPGDHFFGAARSHRRAREGLEERDALCVMRARRAATAPPGGAVAGSTRYRSSHACNVQATLAGLAPTSGNRRYPPPTGAGATGTPLAQLAAANSLRSYDRRRRFATTTRRSG